MKKADADEDEEDLLQMQRELMAQHRAPAAKVKLVGRSRAGSKPVHGQPEQPGAEADTALPGPGDVSADKPAEGGDWIVGGIVERPVQAPSAPAAAAAAAPAFPAATHRKLSKFALGRQSRAKASATPAGADIPAQQHVSRHAQLPADEQRSQPEAVAGAANGAAAAAPGGGGDRLPGGGAARPRLSATSSAEASSEAERIRAEIDAENRRKLAGMSAAEVAAARRELEENLGADKAAFLRSRAGSRGSRVLSSTSGEAAAPAEMDALAHDETPQEPLHQSEVHSRAPGHTGAPAQAAAASVDQTAAPTGPAAAAPAALEAAVEGGPSSVERLRFSMEGNVVSLRAAGEDGSSAVQRDLLRQDERGGAAGYTLRELCQLARSSLPAQRAAACRHLEAVLLRARPSAFDRLLTGEPRPRPVAMPAPAPGEEATQPQPDWADVWRHALAGADVTTALRVALDDRNAAVLTAAARALAALCGAEGLGPVHEAGSGRAELPRVPVRYLHRPHAVGAWMAHPVARAPPAEEPDQAPPPHPLLQADTEEPTEAQVAAEDPLCGLLQMQVLSRIAYILEEAMALGAVEPLLELLASAASAGQDAAEAISAEPGLVTSLMGILERQPAGGQHGAQAMFPPAARPRALAVLRLLCQASASLARQLNDAGLGAYVKRFLLSESAHVSAQAAPSANTAALHLQVEALRTWAACAAYGIHILSLDDAYPALCARLSPPSDWEAFSAGGGAPSPGAHLRLAVMADAHRAAAALMARASATADAALVTPRCAAALGEAALGWLAPGQVAGLIRLACRARSGDTVLAAQAALSSLAAALTFLKAAAQHPGLDTTALKARLDAALGRRIPLSSGWGSPGEQSDRADSAEASSRESWHSNQRPVCQVYLCRQLLELHQLLQPDRSYLPEGDEAIEERQYPFLNKLDPVERAGLAVSAVDAVTPLIGLTHLAQKDEAVREYVADEALQAFCNMAHHYHLGFRQEREAASTAMSPHTAMRMDAQQHLLGMADEALQVMAVCVGDRDPAGELSRTSGPTCLEVSCALALLCLVPPGGEDLALRALAAALGTSRALPATLSSVRRCIQELEDFLAAGGVPLPLQRQICTSGVFAEAASVFGAWWQQEDEWHMQDDSLLCPAPELPDANDMGAVLLRTYAAHWLGLVPEEAQHRTPAAMPAAAQGSVQSLMRQPVGSRLPLPLDWMFQIGTPWKGGSEARTLAAIPETGPEPDQAAAAAAERVRLVGFCMTFLLGVSAPFSRMTWALPAGVRLKGVMDLVFCPEGGTGEPLYQDPLIRWTAAAMLDVILGPRGRPEGSLERISEADAARWAARFAADSYGDALFASALALLLRPCMPPAVQVAVLSVLSDEAALHLLPPLDKAPGGADAYFYGTHPCAAPGHWLTEMRAVRGETQEQPVPLKPAREVLQVYAQLESQPAFGQAVRERSMVPDLLAWYRRHGWL